MYEPEIVGEVQEGSSARVRLRISPTLAYFAGHFPTWPILPGVVQVNWAANMAHRFFGERGVFLGMDNIKFHRVVRPGMELELALSFDEHKNRIDFSFDRDGLKYSSGRLNFGERP